jgi:hypothetical protein
MSGRTIHPIRGVLAGILSGLGLAVLLISLGVVTFGTNAPFVVFGVAFVVVVLWSVFGPVRRRRAGA